MVAGIRRGARRLRRRVSSQQRVWRRALPTEVEFWAHWIETRGADWPDDFRRRFEPEEPLQEPLVLQALDHVGGRVARLLDVGAGPATWLGKRHPRMELQITAVDPLAREYDRLLEEAGLAPPVRTLAVAGEDLRAAFAPESFDIAYARNSLDHSADPLRIVEQMLDVVRAGGFVLLRHWENEAATMGYEELHQWNFAVEDGHLVVWNDRKRIDVTDVLAGTAEVEAAAGPGGEHARWVTASLRRL